MQTKTREAVEIILNADESDLHEAIEALQARANNDTELTEEELKILTDRLDELEANGFKGLLSEEEVEARFRTKGL